MKKSGTSGSNRKPPGPKPGVLPTAPLPDVVLFVQSERSDLNRRSPVPRTGAITRLRHVLMVSSSSVARMGIEPGHRPEGLVRRLERAVSCTDRRTGRVVFLCGRTFHAVDSRGARILVSCSSGRCRAPTAGWSRLSYQSVFLCWMNPRKKPDVAVTPSFA